MNKRKTQWKKKPYVKKRYYGNKLPATLKSYGPEIKCIDIPKGALNFKIAPTPVLLNGIQTGSAYYNRIGARVELKNIHIRGFVRPVGVETTQTIDGGYARIVIVYDRSPNGSMPLITDILQTRTQTGSVTTTEFSEINLDNRDRFIILRDVEYSLSDMNILGLSDYGQQAYPYNDGKEVRLNEFIKLKGLVTHYKSTSNPCTIADITVGSLYVITIANTDDLFTVDLQTRVRYMDC